MYRWIDLNLQGEPGPMSWFWRILYGVSEIIQGIIWTVTLGFVSPHFVLKIATKLARSRMEEE